jgi:hypothetical protein
MSENCGISNAEETGIMMGKSEKFVRSIYPTAKLHELYGGESFMIDGFPEGSKMNRWDTWKTTRRKAWNDAARQIQRKMLKKLEQ